MTPGVSAGSNHVGASETVAARVICPSAAERGGAGVDTRTTAIASSSDERCLMATSLHVLAGGETRTFRALSRAQSADVRSRPGSAPGRPASTSLC